MTSASEEDAGPFWYNEVPPEIFFNTDKIKGGLVPILQQKWQKEILDQHLDQQQRQILRDQRLARVYFNPTKLYLKPRSEQSKVQAIRAHQEYRRDEDVRTHILARRRENEMCAIYGINYKDVGGISEKLAASSLVSARGRKCQRLKHLPPFSGPHALQLLPWETRQGKLQRDRFQVKIFSNKMAGHRLHEENSKDVRQYTTTPLAVWRQHRFTSPAGCDFRDLKRQTQVAKYKAMKETCNLNEGEPVTVAHAKLTSHFKPWTGKADDNPDCEDFFEDQTLNAAAEEEARKSQQVETKKRAALRHFFQRRSTSQQKRHSIKQLKLDSMEKQTRSLMGDSRKDSKMASSNFTSQQFETSPEQLELKRASGSHVDSASSKESITGPVFAKSEPGGKRKLIYVKKRASMVTRSRKSLVDSKHELAVEKDAKEAQKDYYKSPEEKSNVPKQKSDTTVDAFFENPPTFSVNEVYLEDLNKLCHKTRQKLSFALQPQPIGQFYPDPRKDPKYAACFKKEKRKKNIF